MSLEAWARAWGWVDHLTAGGTTAWRDWDGTGTSRSGLLPGAQHLEVVRRLNLVEPVSEQLARVVLASHGPGRGQQDLELEGVRAASRFGARPVDPTDVATRELLRTASGALAELVLAAPRAAPSPPARTWWRRPRYRLAGDPLLAASYRRQLVGQGRPPGGRHPAVVLVLADYPTYLADLWAAHAAQGNSLSWPLWLGRLADRPVLPPRAGILGLAAEWADRVGPSRVHPVFTPADVQLLVGGRPLQPPSRLSHAALDALRATATTLRLVLEKDPRQQCVEDVLVPWLREADSVGLPGPVVPPRMQGWVRDQAVRIRAGLASAGYPPPTLGLDRMLPGPPAAATPLRDEDVLAVMLRALHLGARGQQPQPAREGDDG